jgi:signal transduction histidine kinase
MGEEEEDSLSFSIESILEITRDNLNEIRIIQEMSNNIERRGLAIPGGFEFRREDQTLIIEIRDYGNGFGTKRLPLGLNRNPGLTSIKEYTELSGGRFSLRSSQTKGTCIEVTWYLANQHSYYLDLA